MKRIPQLAGWPAAALVFFSALIGGLAAGRNLYEWLFPRATWLGRLLPALFLAVAAAALGLGVWRWLSVGQGRQQDKETKRQGEREKLLCLPLSITWQAFLPLLLNLAYLPVPAVDPVRGRFFFLASLWLVALVLARLLVRPAAWRWLGLLFVVAFLSPVYLFTLGRTVGTADTFEFQVVVPQLGIVHPTGYPLYLLLTRLFTFLPLHSVAWRVNLATAVYGLIAAGLVYLLVRRLAGRPLPAVLAAVLFGLSPTFWSQAVEAEVYTLHACIVAAALLLMGERGRQGDRETARQPRVPASLLLAFVLGLGLTNHLTTVLLLPPAALALLFTLLHPKKPIPNPKPSVLSPQSSVLITHCSLLVALFLLPLLLYAYLPLRWAAVNGEPMGVARFVDWVIGGRFQGALQLGAWLRDPARYQVVGRLLAAEWAWTTLPWVGLGLAVLAWRQRRMAAILLLTWLGTLFYALNYYVPDLSVFLIPAHLVMAVCWGMGVAAVVDAINTWRPARGSRLSSLAGVFLLALMFPVLMAAVDHWPAVDASRDDGRAAWGRAVLALPLDPQGAILADSDKFPPLYYLQQAEGLRPEMDIVVLPDEAAYRAELEARLATGQSVYLARFLPGLEGLYSLRSVGPLIEVSRAPLAALPDGVLASDLAFGPIRLLGYDVTVASPLAGGESAVTFYWQATEPVIDLWIVYARWAGPGYEGPVSGQHPANNSYPANAWKADEVVADFHQLPRPVLNKPETLALQVALAPPFTPASELAWQTVTQVIVRPPEAVVADRPLRAQLGPALLTGVSFAGQTRPGTALPLLLNGCGQGLDELVFTLRLMDETGNAAWQENREVPAVTCDSPRVLSTHISTTVSAGRYAVFAHHPRYPAVCGWLAPAGEGCVLGTVIVSGVPLPEGATNFDDKIALLDVELPEVELRPGGQLAVHLTWQALAPLAENYTVFVQVLDAQDRIVGQVDNWPLQGTYPTGQWSPGEVVSDPYLIQLDEELPPGQYRLQVGWYLLATLRRLPVLDESGAAVDDKVVIPGLVYLTR